MFKSVIFQTGVTHDQSPAGKTRIYPENKTWTSLHPLSVKTQFTSFICTTETNEKHSWKERLQLVFLRMLNQSNSAWLLLRYSLRNTGLSHLWSRNPKLFLVPAPSLWRFICVSLVYIITTWTSLTSGQNYTFEGVVLDSLNLHYVIVINTSLRIIQLDQFSRS